MAEIDDVANWGPKQVIDWFRGLDDSLLHYIPNLEEANVTGAQLLSLNYEDLENLGVSAIGHQILILDATELLKQLHYDLEGENLQSRALDLNCRCRALRSHISSKGHKNVNGAEAFRQGPSVALLKLACDVLDSSKLLVMWLDRPPFFSNNELQKVRSDVVRLSHELSTTVQQPVFACTIEDAVLAICADMESLSNQMIASNDVMSIQPAFLEVTHLVNRDPSSGLGLFIKATFEGHHVITGTKEGSISSRIRRITPGDEVVAVGNRNVVGWQLAKLVAALKETQSDISITLKKRPQLTNSTNTLAPLSRRNQKHGRILTAPPVVQPIQTVVEMRKNSVEGSIDSNLDKIGTSKESLNSPKKTTRKRKKLKKEKAKSSSNILAGPSEEMKKMSRQHRGSMSQESSIDRNLRSASSMEAVASSTSNLTKNLHLRKSLEKIWKKEKLDHEKNGKSGKTKAKQSKSENHAKSKKGKTDHGLPSGNMMPNNNDVLEELRARRLKKSETRLIETAKPTSKINHQRYASEPLQQPSSPLDFLVIPPPPSAPYTPRVENVLQSVTDKEALPRSKRNRDKPPGSPNSRLDSEHRRRFTIIGSEQMDEKWYNSLLSEVNAKRAQLKSSLSSKKILERLDETTTASEDSVFTSQSVLAEEITVVKRGPRQIGRNRPMSMPPNYYSAAKLNQFRIGQALGDAKHNGTSSKISDGSSPSPNNIVPVAHQVDANGIKKLAPLNCYIEDVNRSRSGDNSLDSRGSSRVNANNNNLSSSERKRYQTPPKPAPRNTPPSTIGKVSSLKEIKIPPHTVSNLNDKKAMQRVTPESHLHQTNAISSSPTPDQLVQPYNAKSHLAQESSVPRKRLGITEELECVFAKQKNSRPSTSSSDVFSPGVMSSHQWGKNNNSLPRSPAMGTSMVRHQIPSPSAPPVAKPRNMIKSGGGSPKIALMPNLKQQMAQSDAHRTRVKSVDTSELIKTSTARESQRRKSESVSTEKKFADKGPLMELAQASPSSRGSYVAAIDGGFSLDDLVVVSSGKAKEEEASPDSHVIKVIDGVKVKLRKSPALTRSNSNSGKKGRLKIVDQLRASPEMRSQRRVSCRDLGAGECDGWLWKKKTNATSPLSSKWSKRWVVLKDNALYCYHTEEDDKAESYIYLPGYKITPAQESKRKFAFRVAHPQRKTFYFASDRQLDMTRWMNKLGLAAIEYSYPKPDNHTKKEEDYFSESDSEEASNTSQSEPESGTQTPNTSPEKPIRNTQNAVSTATPPRKRTGRHMSTQPDLNRSARYPRNKAEVLKSSATTQTTESLPREMRNRSKSETTRPGKSVNPESNESHSPVTTARQTSVISPENRKPKPDDTPQKQLQGSAERSSNIEINGTKSSQSDELKQIANDKVKASEVKRESQVSTSSAASGQSGDSQNSTGGLEMFRKSKKQKNTSLNSPKKNAVDDKDCGSTNDDQSLRGQRGVVERTRLRSASAPVDQETNQVKDGSMDDLRKALQNADVDFRGVSRKATLKRRVTILARDPKKNNLLLRKRALQRQIKAREGELEYIKLLDDQVITAELIHEWINQHQSFFSDLGTIRRLSKRRKNLNKSPQSEQTLEKQSDDNDASTTVPSTTQDTSTTTSPVPATIPPVPAKRTSLLLGDDVFKQANNEHHKSLDSESPPAYSLGKVIPIDSRVRPRSWAISGSESEKVKARSSRSISPHHETPSSDSDKHYLETDL